MSIQKTSPYRFALIAPYGNLSSAFIRLAAGINCTLTVRNEVAFDEAVAVAKELVSEEDPEVIFSRGGTADYIRKAVDVPVVAVSTSALDLMRTLVPFAGSVKHVAFFNYEERLPEVQSVAQGLGITIDEYEFHSREDMLSHMIEAKARGAQLGIGGILISRMRETCGLDGILIEAGEGAIQRALREAVSIAQIRRREQERQARLTTILNSIAEGMIVTDENNILTHINPAAERLLAINAEKALGKKGSIVIPNSRIQRVLDSGEPELGQVQDMGGYTVVTNRVPIVLDGRSVGVVCTFSEADRIQRAEQRLRGRMHSKGFFARYRVDDIITTSPMMEECKELAELYARSDATILLQGESGTGKELFAQGIHQASPRSKGPFVAINCAAIPETLLESELFGYEEGAFTGARRQGKAGLFEMAHQGTLFLDEVSELPKCLQTRLLRVLQEREIVRVGGSQVIPVDVRIICATNRDLAAWTGTGNFRQDLYYRMNVLLLTIPPLRERGDDILFLALRFLRAAMGGKDVDETFFHREISPRLLAHTWPGNVRELASTMERLALVMSMNPHKSGRLLECLWQLGFDTPQLSDSPTFRQTVDTTDTSDARDGWLTLTVSKNSTLKELTRKVEAATISNLLREHGNDQSKVAALLGISRMSLWRKMQGCKKA